jgi:hypothetical protein
MNVLATTPRATRYDLQTRILYRAPGEERWQEGQAVNVSRTGVLFTPLGVVLPPHADIEFVLELPTGACRRHTRIACRGLVARCGQAGAIAATITSYSFLDPNLTVG